MITLVTHFGEICLKLRTLNVYSWYYGHENSVLEAVVLSFYSFDGFNIYLCICVYTLPFYFIVTCGLGRLAIRALSLKKVSTVHLFFCHSYFLDSYTVGWAQEASLKLNSVRLAPFCFFMKLHNKLSNQDACVRLSSYCMWHNSIACHVFSSSPAAMHVLIQCLPPICIFTLLFRWYFVGLLYLLTSLIIHYHALVLILTHFISYDMCICPPLVGLIFFTLAVVSRAQRRDFPLFHLNLQVSTMNVKPQLIFLLIHLR